MFRRLSILALLALSACRGPLMFPAVVPPTAEEKAQVDQEWHNMLTPTYRLDNDLLLDVIIFDQLHVAAVDRMTYESEKDIDGGKIHMTVTYDQAHPNFSIFEIEIFNADGKLARSEHYSSDHVLERVKTLFGVIPVDALGEPVTTKPSAEEEKKLEEAMNRRLMQMAAATQPAQ